VEKKLKYNSKEIYVKNRVKCMLKIFAMADDETILIAVRFAERNIKSSP